MNEQVFIVNKKALKFKVKKQQLNKYSQARKTNRIKVRKMITE